MCWGAENADKRGKCQNLGGFKSALVANGVDIVPLNNLGLRASDSRTESYNKKPSKKKR